MAFKELELIPQYKATARLAGFLQSVSPSAERLEDEKIQP
jgi:hypothetical protein